MKSKPAKAKPQPGDAAHKFFEFAPDLIDAVRIRHIVVDTQHLCDSIYSMITSHETSLADIASSLSRCESTRATHGDLGWWNHDDLVPLTHPAALVDDTLLEKSLSVRPNTLHKHQSMHGFHVFTVEESRHKLPVLKTYYNTFEKAPVRTNKRAYDEFQKPLPNTYCIQTLGCQMNKSDSERMEGILQMKGYQSIDDAFKAQLLIINTCNIREHAELKVYSYLGKHKLRKQKFPNDVMLVVCGCVAQQEGEKLLKKVPQLDIVFGPQYVNRIHEMIDSIQLNKYQICLTEPTHIIEDFAQPKRHSRTTAWINVMYGCGENCTFCTVGNVVRSTEQSRSMQAIKREIQQIVTTPGNTIREVFLLGQNIDAYGRDFFPKLNFSKLLQFIHDVDGIDRIRFTTSHPRYISQGLVDTCARLPKVMPFFHIPPQSGNSLVLKQMKRGYSVEQFTNVVNRIRDKIPDAAIAGDMIVGFPGETEDQFRDSLALIESIGFDVMNTAAYSPRPNTPAATWTNQVPDSVKSDRLRIMNDVVTDVAHRRSLRYEGRTELVLVEQQNPKREDQVVGRTESNRPVYFTGDSNELVGKIVPVKIVKAFPFSLQGEKCGPPS